jgi:radical SAM superfamily enzyme YgiQ (UPF0313 family)
MPPVGLWQLRDYLKHPDVQIDICDLHAGDSLDNYLKCVYDIIGLSIQFSIQHDEYVRLAHLLRPWTRKLYAGGVHAANVVAPKEIDAVSSGHGELFFSEIMTTVPLFGNPKFELSEIEKYWKIGKPHNLKSATGKWMSFTASYGCNFSCGFCGMKDYWGPLEYLTLRFISEKLRYLEYMGIEELFIEDDNIAYRKNQFLEIMSMLKMCGFKWSTPNGIYAKTLLNNPEIIPVMKDSGCWRVSLPFEAGNKNSARCMNTLQKYIEFSDARDLVNRLKDSGIETNGFFIIGYPGETLEDMQNTLDYANALPLDGRSIYIATPYPGTGLYRECKEKGYLRYDGPELYRNLLYANCMIDTPEWRAEEVDELRLKDREKAMKKIC